MARIQTQIVQIKKQIKSMTIHLAYKIILMRRFIQKVLINKEIGIVTAVIRSLRSIYNKIMANDIPSQNYHHKK
jgi:hypothetical protein